MKKSKFITILTIILLVISLFTITVKADESKSETVTIRVWNSDEGDCATILSILGDKALQVQGQEHGMGEIITVYKSDIEAITSIDLSNLNLTNYSYLKNFPNLMELNLSNKALNTIPDLSELESLKSLNLNNNSITDIGGLAQLNNLTLLNLKNNKISDINPLKDLTKLISLHIDNNNISDLSAISKMTALQELSASNNNISDLSPLSNFTVLRALDLSSNLISDISSIKGMNVRTLNLSNNNISDISNVEFTKYQSASFDNNKIIDGWEKLDVGRPVSAKQQRGNIETSNLTVALPDIISSANKDHATITTDNGVISSDYTTITFDGTKDEVIANINITGGMGTFDKSVVTVHYKKAINTDQNKDDNKNKPTTDNNNPSTEDVDKKDPITEENKTQEDSSSPKVTLENVNTPENQKVEDTSTANGKMPYTGITRSITIAGIIVALVVLVVHTYYQNKKFEN